jgi:hypothetical protein
MADDNLTSVIGGEMDLPAVKTSQVTVNLSAADRATLERIFGGSELNEVANNVAQSAFEEWIGWLSARRRYTSITDQTIDRVIEIYARAMRDAEPEVGFLYNKFNIPYGSARYIIQAIVNRQLYELNARALKRLIFALEVQAEYLNNLSDAERKVLQEIRVVTDPRAEKMLTTIIELMPIEERPVSTFRRLPTSLPNTREYAMSPRDLKPILEAVKKFCD